MSTTTARTPAPTAPPRGTMADGRRRSPLAMIVMPLLALLWTVPTLGLLVTSFRTREAAAASGWWSALTQGGWTLDNYAQVLGSASMGTSLVNSIVVASGSFHSVASSGPSLNVSGSR